MTAKNASFSEAKIGVKRFLDLRREENSSVLSKNYEILEKKTWKKKCCRYLFFFVNCVLLYAGYMMTFCFHFID